MCGALLVQCGEESIKAAWDALDTDRSGSLSFGEFKRVLPLDQEHHPRHLENQLSGLCAPGRRSDPGEGKALV